MFSRNHSSSSEHSHTSRTSTELEALNEKARNAAYCGDCKQAEFYRRQGASLAAIGRAVGLSKNWRYAEFLLRQHPENDALLNELSIGFSMQGDHSAVRKLIALGADVNAVLFGSAFHGGDMQWTMELFHRCSCVNIAYIFFGAIAGKQTKWIRQLQQWDEKCYQTSLQHQQHLLALTAQHAQFEEYRKFLHEINKAVFSSHSTINHDTAFFSYHRDPATPSQQKPLDVKPPQSRQITNHYKRKTPSEINDTHDFLPAIIEKQFTAKPTQIRRSHHERRNAITNENHLAGFLPQLGKKKNELHRHAAESSVLDVETRMRKQSSP